MRALHTLGACLIVAGLVLTRGLQGSASQTAVQLKPGDPAPPFSLQGSDGRTYRLADYRGKQAVVLAWFVKAFSAG